MKRIFALCVAALMLTTCLTSCNLFSKKEDESEDSEKNIEFEVLAQNESTEYQIVISGEANDNVKTLSKRIADAIKDKADIKIDRVTDDVSKYPEKTKEIILGVADRSASATAMASLGNAQWRVYFEGDKLLVVGSNDYCLERAVEFLTTEAMVLSDGALLVDKATDKLVSEDMLPISSDGKVLFNIIYPAKAIKEVSESAIDMGTRLGRLMGAEINVMKDAYASEEGMLEIIVGKTARNESESAYRALGKNDIICRFEGGSMVVAAGLDTQVDVAAGMLVSYFVEAVAGTYAGDYCIDKSFAKNGIVSEWLSDVPEPSVGTFVGSDDIGDGTHILCWNDVDGKGYESYLASLAAAGFVTREGGAYTLGDNQYKLMDGKRATLYVSYIVSQEQLRVYAEKLNSSLYPSSVAESFVAAEGVKPTLWQLENDWYGIKSNAGMSYIIQVSDGSFILIDGGYNTEDEAKAIYEHMRSRVPDGEKPIVSAWFISHGHNDHYGALNAVTERYLNDITVKAFYYNTPFEGFGDDYQTGFISNMKKWSGAKLYGKIHSGMRFYIADAQFDVLYTHEDLYPIMSNEGNNTSFALRMKLDGKTVIFLGDIATEASSTIEKNISEAELKCDIVQYAHHGYEGANRRLYDMMEAATVLWPMNICGWTLGADGSVTPVRVFAEWISESRSSSTVVINRYIAFEAEYVKKIYISGFGNTEIILSEYVPEGDRLPDYEARYEELASITG